ncbi:hypothetical protein GWN26_08455, partial [Candidatus Saccharibacteria bacterium]|nr:hypothetical protein [Candidatus Saccharibacteria bacterium]NIW79457.1 hypothetical protein [Calditrichia bacterium]
LLAEEGIQAELSLLNGQLTEKKKLYDADVQAFRDSEKLKILEVGEGTEEAEAIKAAT